MKYLELSLEEIVWHFNRRMQTGENRLKSAIKPLVIAAPIKNLKDKVLINVSLLIIAVCNFLLIAISFFAFLHKSSIVLIRSLSKCSLFFKYLCGDKEPPLLKELFLKSITPIYYNQTTNRVSMGKKSKIIVKKE